ncbi:MAG: hypothetical protein L3J23_03950 [Flavobacteriaceae bacterium]|nr:hypothetical protein [Flavobacteriaceae bacterium]
MKIDADTFIGIDNQENIYYIKNNILYKKMNSKTITYSNLHLGKISSIDIINPLKIVVFYKNFNSIIILDDALNELSNNIDFNNILFKNISFVGTSTNSNLWLFSEEDNNLMLFDYITKKVVLTKQLDSEFKFLKACSNYQNIWLILEDKILKYNAYGSLIAQYNSKKIERAVATKNGLIYKNKGNLYQLFDTNKSELIAIDKDQIIKNFYSKNNNLLYFFDGNVIYKHNFIKK